MREIKFRSWNKTNGKYFDSQVLLRCINNNSCHVYEQYTGFKNKDGAEICEGDVIEWYNAPGMPHGKADVIFNVDRGAWYIENDADDVYSELYNVYDYSEIIGNIHEQA